MHRISRPLRAGQSSLRQSCRQPRGIPSYETSFRPAWAAFSTGQPRNFLLSGKQDKKKHQQFVRRWQKRLLGDSEPIGAHVDPYDPTSPVRIAPEEQGDYEEVLDDDTTDKGRPAQSSDIPIHLKKGRLHVGGEQWQQEKHQMDLAREFEKLTLRTYTPLTLDMANDIEKLTGTCYTLKDENLLLAQKIHNTTGRPYTTYNFGLWRKMTDPQGLRRCFAQAIAELYTLNQAGLGMDLSKFANCGIYEQPSWIRDVKLVLDKKGEPVLAFPKGKSADQLLQAMRAVPAWGSIQATEEETVAIEESMPLSEPIQDQESPTVDPSSPNLKRAALVKTDTDKKPFDFMSNRPVSRSKSTEKVETTDVFQHHESGAPQVNGPPSLSPSLAELNATAESSRVAIIQMRHDVLEHQAQRLLSDIQAWGQNVKQMSTGSAVEDVKWHQIPLTSIDIKFALFKRLFQLTGIKISDPQLTDANTLGDLYGFLCATAKPKPASLFSTIHIEGQKAREQAKQRRDQELSAKRRADLGDLIKLGNVEIRNVKPTKQELRDKIGLGKVIRYALLERGLVKPSKTHRKARRWPPVIQET